MQKYAVSLALTLFTEGLLSALLSKNKDWVICVLLVNMITNPAVNLLFNGLKPLLGDGRAVVIAVLEAAVVITEAALFHRYRKKEKPGLPSLTVKKCILYSATLNMFSFWTGVLFQRIA